MIPTDGGGWQCNKNCCLLPENMRTSYPGFKRSAHDKMHNTPGIWSEVPNLLAGDKKFYCSKCPGTRGTGMIDYVTAPNVKKSIVSAPFHSFYVSALKAHVEASGVARKKQKVSSAIVERRLTLASEDIPFAHPPTQCALYGKTYSSSAKDKCHRSTCLLNSFYGASYSWSIFTDFDWSMCATFIKSQHCLNKTICLCVVSVCVPCQLSCKNLLHIFQLWRPSSLYHQTKWVYRHRSRTVSWYSIQTLCDKKETIVNCSYPAGRPCISVGNGPGQLLGSYVISRVLSTRLVQWLSWVFATEERKKESILHLEWKKESV